MIYQTGVLFGLSRCMISNLVTHVNEIPFILKTFLLFARKYCFIMTSLIIQSIVLFTLNCMNMVNHGQMVMVIPWSMMIKSDI